MERIGAAIIGIGRIGQIHLRNMIDSNCVDVMYMLDVPQSHQKIKELIQIYNLSDASVRTPEEVHTVLQDERVKMVVICVPTAFHKEFILKSLKAGKHVFCEKPLCITVEDVEECYNEAILQNRVLMCALNRRFDKQFSKIFNLAREGRLGNIRSVKMESRDNQTNVEYFAHNKGGIFLDMGIHDIDYISWLVDSDPESCTAIGSNSSVLADGFKSYGEYDTAMGMIKFKNGILAHVNLQRVTCGGYQQTVTVMGTKQIAQTTDVRESQLELLDDKGTHLFPYFLVDGFIDRYLDSFKEEMNHFVRVIQGKEECLVTGDSVIRSTKLVYMLTEALKDGTIVGSTV